jgi:hypothetical protein
MIGKITIGKSFRGCISYCLDKDRAELLDYQLCFGDKREIIQQFNELRQLNPKLTKPVLHISLSWAPGEKLTKENLHHVLDQAARDMGYENNQWIAVAHHDSGHPHLHIVVNRIGFDGRTVSDSNNYKRIAGFCRRMEIELGLQPVQSPRRFLPVEERRKPRLDQRKERLRTIITEALKKARDYAEFEHRVRAAGYEVVRARGIRFIDDRKVKVKGSELGYSLQRIEQLLKMDRLHRNLLLEQLEKRTKQAGVKTSATSKRMDKHPETIQSKDINKPGSATTLQQAVTMLADAGKQGANAINPELRKKRKRKHKGLI